MVNDRDSAAHTLRHVVSMASAPRAAATRVVVLALALSALSVSSCGARVPSVTAVGQLDRSVPCGTSNRDFPIPLSEPARGFYQKILDAAGEGPLCVGADVEERYRLVLLTSIRRQMVVRVERRPGGSVLVVAKVLSGDPSDDEPLRVTRRAATTVTPAQAESLSADLRRVDYWGLATEVRNPGGVVILDGAQMALEAVRHHRHHVVVRDWVQEFYPDFIRLCDRLISLTGLSVRDAPDSPRTR
jgi:hypothetical protein